MIIRETESRGLGDFEQTYLNVIFCRRKATLSASLDNISNSFISLVCCATLRDKFSTSSHLLTGAAIFFQVKTSQSQRGRSKMRKVSKKAKIRN